ncbi:hypothetical protein TNCV_4597231 [Trichonephila clavipes]|uniref:Uncharacterized protein n=1 Tax=Trichonephila clavipes TaxID=2585209 RepID=A0A8X6WFS4_TRICX|nr:hypothetical protein TNCV_4597231 [Trichonephila clavipes]
MPAVVPLTPALRISPLDKLHLPRSLRHGCPPPIQPRVFEAHITSERSYFVKGKSRILSTSKPTPLNSLQGSLSLPQSPLIGDCNSSTPGSPHCRSTPWILGDNRPARLIPTPKLHRILEARTCLVTFILRVHLCLILLTSLSIQFVCVPDVRGEFIIKGMFLEDSFLWSVGANDRLYVGEKRCGDIKAIL